MAFPTGWGRRCALTIQSSKVDGDLSDFTVKITKDCLPSEMFDADGSYPARSDGGDIRFSSDQAGTTQLAREVAQFDTDNDPGNGYAELYVLVDDVYAVSDVTIYVWYNAPSETEPAEDSTYGKESAWPSGYNMVHHFCAGPGSQADSTSNDVDGTAQGTNALDDGEHCDDSSWYLYDSTPNPGARDCGMNVGQTAAVDNIFDGGGTIIHHYYPTDVGMDSNPYGWLFDGDNATGCDLFTRDLSGGSMKLHFRAKWTTGDGDWITSSTVVTQNDWNIIISKYNDDATANNPTLYVNDSKLTEGSGLGSDNPTGSFKTDAAQDKFVCCQEAGWADPEGYIDEVRFLNYSVTDAEAGTLYNSIADPSTFVVEGTPESPTAAAKPWWYYQRNHMRRSN